MKAQKNLQLLLVQILLSYEWLSAGIEKFTKPDFMAGIAKTMGAFEAKTTYHWYAQFLAKLLSHATLFGNLVRLGEVASGAGLLIGALAIWYQGGESPLMRLTVVASLVVGAFLNLNFYLAAGWTGVSTAELNLVMFWLEIILLSYYLGPQKLIKPRWKS